MKIQVRGRNVEVSTQMRSEIERTLRLVLARYGERIAFAYVHLSSAAGEDLKMCRLELRLQPRRVEAEDVDADLMKALGRAARRVSRSLGRLLEREKTSD